ncbi:hypothetical protein [uncultured Thiothrix sp.]|uniref:hypothetical protein n=1 Tax=uncultured Thiothrix sp. TaxID=223185 RepID=UPI0026238E3E|nr:hypothetical protein [uncultured Thiothrix sp.]
MTPFDDDFNNQDYNLGNNNFENHIFSHQDIDTLSESIETEPQVAEATDPLVRRVTNSYQILAAAVIRANQCKTDLEARINQAQQQIDQYQQQLTQISEQLIEDQVETLPQNEQLVVQQLDTMNGCIRGKHYNNLMNRLNELPRADYSNLPTIIDSMRAELDLIEIRAQKIKILEGLREAYRNHQYFQNYYQQADAEFRRLFNQY